MHFHSFYGHFHCFGESASIVLKAKVAIMAPVAKSLTAKFKNSGSHCTFTIHLIFPITTKFYIAIS